MSCSDKTTAEYLEDWVDWESDNDLHAPENIGKAGERNFQSPDYQQDRELRYAAGRAWKELNEALEVAEAVDRAERGEEVDFEKYFEYTRDNELYDEDAVSDREQLMDEFGFEAADVTLFALKMSTAVETGFGSDEYGPDLENMASALETSEESGKSYEEATEEIQENIDPDYDRALYQAVMAEDQNPGEIAGHAEEMVENLSRIAATLPKGSLSEYITEKIRYNIEERELENMDADHPNPEEEEFKRDFEK
jgi:NTP pyrophosphatase (non-canonical NTP hydrolase)